MQNLFLTVDKVSTFIGHCFSWLVIGLTALIGFEVFSRYVLNSPHAWAFDAQIMLYGTMFMMAGAYTLAKNGHVRGDILYGFLKPRTQAIFDLILYIVFFIPGVIALAYAGYGYAADSWRILEHSSITADGPPIYPFKTIIPIAGVVLLLQGIIEIYAVWFASKKVSGLRGSMTLRKSTSMLSKRWLARIRNNHHA